MDRIDPKIDTDRPGNLSNALVALYLTQETGLPCNTTGYEISSVEAKDSAGARVERRALRVTFDPGASTKQPRLLLTFGSDDQLCNVVLKATEASLIHCRVYAQLNSGPGIWVIEDTSAIGTKYLDEESLRTNIPKNIARGRVAVQGLCRIQIGRTIFGFWLPSNKQEKSHRERYFRNLDPVLVTEEMIQEQLRGAASNFRPLEMIGEGGMGTVFRYMELTTGLMIAVKEEKVEKKEADERVQKEIGYMQSLRHPALVEHISSNFATNSGVKIWFTAMPLYQGSLCAMLPLEITAIENVMLQLFDGVAYMHARRILHKDIKPENILVKTKSRPDIVLADYGLCASLNNRAELMSNAGTRGFAAPEVSCTMVQTEAVDVFALGATFFAILEPQRCHGALKTIATLKNVMQRPPRVYAGLVQCMMAYDAKVRPTLKECFEIVRAKQRDWQKRTIAACLLPPAPIAFGPRRSTRLQKALVQKPSALEIPRLAACKPGLTPNANIRKARIRLGLQQAPGRDFKAWLLQERNLLGPPPAPQREPQPPAPVQRVNFAAPPPLSPANPFADLNHRPDIAPPPRRQAPPATQELARTPIRKTNSEIKRKIRRGPERRQMVERWQKLGVQGDKIRLGFREINHGTRSHIFRGLRHITAGGLGLTGHLLGMMFQDFTAARRAINHIVPDTKKWGMTTEQYLVYGLKPHKFPLMVVPLTKQEYEHERLESELKSTEKKRTRARLESVRKVVPEREQKKLDSMLRALPPVASPPGGA